MEEIKKERTIRSETTKVFLIIFAILVIVGIFTIGASIKGSDNFSHIKERQLKQFRAAETMKDRALEIIAIYYLLATDQDQEVLMRELKRYDGLIANFDQARADVIAAYKTEGPEKKKIMTLLNENKVIFDELNNTCRRMTFAMMNGDKKASAAEFPNIDSGIKKFKVTLDAVEGIVSAELDREANQAQYVFKQTTKAGVFIIILAVFVTIGLIYYLMTFLSISLLPISNLMHNMRQAVFSIDKDLNIIAPVSAYSKVVFGEDIVAKNITEIVYKETNQTSEAYSKNKMAFDVVFGADDLQWMLQEDGLIRQVTRKIPEAGEIKEKILKLTYTPLMKNNLVENIMIVAEDVTEIEALRAESLASQLELEIIKSIIEITPYELESFLNEAGIQIGRCFELVEQLKDDSKARLALFRILHTEKGNARMYKLNAISEAIHKTENVLSELRQSLENSDLLAQSNIDSIKEGLGDLERLINQHWKISAKIYKKNGPVGIVGDENLRITLHSLCEKIGAMAYELSSQLGKDIHFTLMGDDLELTQNKARSLQDALIHIVRNCLDHGIESPDERSRKGKNPKASLLINIKHHGSRTEITVSDDGRGIDSDKLVKKALSLGTLKSEQIENLSHDERLQLIFVPNLSTKDEVSDISGRGVGMDAVKDTISKLGGNITVCSGIDTGTEFKMCI